MNSGSNFWDSVVCFVLVLSCSVIGPEHYSENVYSILSVATFIFGFMSVIYGAEHILLCIFNFIKQKRGSGNE